MNVPVPGASLRTRAVAGERLLGVLVRMPNEELAEMAAVSGFDFVLVDCEHGPADLAALRQHVAVASLHGVPVLVRVGQGEAPLVLRVLDHGAQGVVAPHVDTAEQAAELVAACHYPPLGRRGFATYGRAGRFGLADAAGHRAWFLANTLVIAMIESPAAAAGVDDVLNTPGLDGIMVGPADLATSSGPDDPPPAQSLARVHERVAAAGRIRMDVVNDPDAARAAFANGAAMVVYNLTHTLMGHLRDLREAAP